MQGDPNYQQNYGQQQQAYDPYGQQPQPGY